MESKNYGENSGVVASNINGPVQVNQNYYEKKRRLPSLLPKFIERLAELVNTEENVENGALNTQPYDINDKINHNNLIAYKDLVDDYGSYYYTCERAFEIINSSIKHGSKTSILRNISEIYKEKKRILILENKVNPVPIDLIRLNADKLIDQVRKEVKERIENAYTDEDIFDDDIDFCLSVFLCYAFCECKILEKPPVVQL